MRAERIVVDTNVVISAVLRFSSTPGKAVSKVLDNGILLVSDATLNELADVLVRPKLDVYVSLDLRVRFLRQLSQAAENVSIIQRIHECRDPRDNKFLELALNGRADAIITGDADLLALHPWREIAILTPAEYLKQV